MVDKAIGISIKNVSLGTQYHQLPGTTTIPKPNESTKIKFVIEKTKEKGLNTDISFPPYSNVSFKTLNANEGDLDEMCESSSDGESIENESLDPTFQTQDETSDTDTGDNEPQDCLNTQKKTIQNL